MIVGVYDATDKLSNQDVSDWLASNLQDPLARVKGVGDSQVFGAQYAMRIWLNPDRLASFSLMPSDVVTAIQNQNTEIAAGEIGGQPMPKEQMLNATVTAQSRLQTPEQFANIILKTDRTGATVHLKDVARVELGAESYNSVSRVDGHPGAGIAISLSPGADALTTADLVKAKVAEIAKVFPAGVKYAYANDTTAFIKLSIEEVVITLFEAIVLVVVVMFVFLQTWRATLIPTIAVPVVLLGTFGDPLSRRLHDQHADFVRTGALDRPARRRRDRRGRERRAADGGESRDVAARGDDPVDGADPGRAGGDRAGALGGVPADGVLRRVDRRDLPAVLDHDRLGDGAFGDGRADPEPGADRDAAQEQEAGARCRRRLDRAALPRRVGVHRRCAYALQHRLRADREAVFRRRHLAWSTASGSSSRSTPASSPCW